MTLIGIVAEEATHFPVRIADMVLDLLTYKIIELDLVVLDLLSHLMNCASESTLLKIFGLLMRALCEEVTKEGPIIVVEEIGTVPESKYPVVTASGLTLRFVAVKTFANGLKLKSTVRLSDKVDFAQIMRNRTYNALSIMVRAASSKPLCAEMLIRSCIVALSDFNTRREYLFDMGAVFVAICHHLIQFVDIPNMAETLLSPPFFSPMVTVFDNNENFEDVNMLRVEIAEWIMSYRNGELVDVLLQKWVRYPKLFTEIVYRILRNMSSLAINEANASKLSRALMTVSQYYQQCSIDGMNDPEIEMARNAIFLLISQMLQSNETMEVLFSNPLFTTFFLSFVFEVPLRDFIISHLRNFLIGRQSAVPNGLISSISQICHLCTHSFPDEASIHLVEDIIQTLNDVLSHHLHISDSFIPIGDLLYTPLTQLNDTETARSFMLQVLQFYCLTCNSRSWSEQQISSIETAIENVFGANITQTLQQRMLQLVAGECLAAFSPSFVIRNPQILKLYLKTSLLNSTAVECTLFIKDLCEYVPSNCVACHMSGFDLFVVDMLCSLRYEKDDKLTEALLGLFGQIASVISSVAVVQRFISLLAADDGKNIPIHQLAYIRTLNAIMSTTSRYPAATIPLSEGTIVDIGGVVGSDIENGFTFMWWCFVDSMSSQYKPWVITLVDQRNNAMRVFLANGNLFYVQRRNGHDISGKIDISIPERTWFCCSLMFANSSYTNDGYVGAYLNCSLGKTLETPAFRFAPGPVEIRIGGHRSQTDFPVAIGPFGLFRYLGAEHITTLCELGPRIRGRMPVEPLFFCVPQQSDNSLIVSQLPSKRQVSVRFSHNARGGESSFTDALIKVCKVEILLPLFYQMTLVSPSDRSFQGFCKAVVDLVTTSLLVSEEAQESFTKASACSIIALFLTTINEKYIDYSLYLQFATLVQGVTSHDLQVDLFEKIIFNPEIWTRCDPESQVRVIRHWARMLAPSVCSNSVLPCVSFAKMLFILRAYYWYEPEEEPKICGRNRARGMDLNITECRQLLVSIAVTAATHNFSRSDMDLFRSHCLTICEDRQIVDLLGLLKQLVMAEGSPLRGEREDVLLSFLMSISARNNSDIYLLVVEILWNYYIRGFISFEALETSAMTTIERLNTKMITNGLLDSIIDVMLSNEFYGLLGHCFWVAANLDASAIISTVEKLKPAKCYIAYGGWMIWPVTAALKIRSEDATRKVLEFLIDCSRESWKELYETVRCVGITFYGSADEEIAMMLEIMVDRLLILSTPEGLESYLDIIHSFVFFRDEHQPSNTYLNALFEASPYTDGSITTANETVNVFEELLASDTVLRASSIIHRLMKYTKRRCKFGLRFNREGRWLDQSICLHALDVCLKFSNHDTLKISMLMASFLAVESYSHVVAHVGVRSIPAGEVNGPIIAIVDKRACRMNKRRLTARPVWDVEVDAFSALEELANELHQSGDELSRMHTILRDCLQAYTSTDSIVVSSLNQMHSLIDSIKLDGIMHDRAWVRLWRCLASDRAAWGKSLPSAVPFTRDFTSCAFFCQSKLKRNWKFSAHDDAVKARVTGRASKTTKKKEKEVKLKVPKMVDDSESKNDKPLLELQCILVTTRIEKRARFILFKNRIRFVYEATEIYKDVLLDDLKYAFFRRRFHLPNSMELFMVNGKNLFVYFPDDESLPVLSKMATLYMPNIEVIQTQPLQPYFKANNLTSKWLAGKISNFEYLMHLNMMSGRSFNDFSQYPIFPWIFSDYKSDTINIDDPSVYRDLSRPIGSLGKARLEELLDRLPQLSAFEDPYLYGSGHNCQLTVCLFMIRLEPFTSQHISLQSGRFDHGGRIFSSIQDSYRVVTSLLNDYRELIPEFFCMPEIFINLNHFDLGENDNGVVDDVVLPPWASSAYDFVYTQRKGLESSTVSETLSSWIDLIWGYKQRGENALAAHNLYKSEFYDTVWEKNDFKDPFVRTRVETTLCHIGQVPPQLFTEKHPVKSLPREPNLLTDVFTVAYDEAKITVSFIENPARFKYNIVAVDASGFLITYQIDFRRLALSKRAKSMSLNDQVKWPSIGAFLMDGGAREEETEIKHSSTRKAIKNFSKYEFLESFVVRDQRQIVMIDSTDNKIVSLNCANLSIDTMPVRVTRPFELCGSGEYLGIAGQDAVLSIFKNSTPYSIMPSYRDSITCSCINKAFQIALIGTCDGYIILNSMNKGSTVRVLDLGGAKPVKITMTDGWGFIVVYATKLERGRMSHSLLLFSVNGDLLKQRTLDSPVSCWKSWTSTKSFDYMVMSDDKGRIFCFEVFYMNLDEPLFKCHASVSAVDFASDVKSVVAVTKQGRIWFIPCDIENT